LQLLNYVIKDLQSKFQGRSWDVVNAHFPMSWRTESQFLSKKEEWDEWSAKKMRI
jgi:hypothetical protein